MSRVLGAVVGVALFAGVAGAQVGVAWVTFTKQPTMLAVDPKAISDASTQVGFGTGDLDQDGWDDVVAVRKQQASQAGKRTSLLLMNEDGVLIDRTAQYAAVSDMPGDLGFLTPRNTRKCALGDVNLDGWLDVVTANNLSDGDAKNISHPGVYVNQGQDGLGAWLGCSQSFTSRTAAQLPSSRQMITHPAARVDQDKARPDRREANFAV